MSGKIRDSTNVAFEAVIPSNPHTLFAIFGPARGQIYGKTAKKYKKLRVLARRAGYPKDKSKHPKDKSKHPKDKSKHPKDNSKHPEDKPKHPKDKSKHPTDKSRHQTPKNFKND